jgi:hypothetical protein
LEKEKNLSHHRHPRPPVTAGLCHEQTFDLALVATWGACLLEFSYRPYFKFPNSYSAHSLRFTEYEWAAMRPMLPNKPHGVPNVGDRRSLIGTLGCCCQAHCGAVRQTALAHAQPAIIASFAGEGLASGATSGMHSLPLMTSCPVINASIVLVYQVRASIAADGEQLVVRSCGGLIPLAVHRLSRLAPAWPSAPRCRSRTDGRRSHPRSSV